MEKPQNTQSPENAKEGAELDKRFIRRCIELAARSMKEGDYPFGAVITTKDGKQIAEGLNTTTRTRNRTGHAEVNAIEAALEKDPNLDLSECTLYSNFEPCPMCSFLVREHGVGRVVFGLSSPHWGGYSRWKILTDKIPAEAFARAKNQSPPSITGGILADEVKLLFDKWRSTMYRK